jgi:cytochrome b6-f complex iron-sulfur subunit
MQTDTGPNDRVDGTRDTSSRADRKGLDRQRRGFLEWISTVVMASGLASGYGLFLAHAGRFLYPSGRGRQSWQFVATLDQLKPGESLPFKTPTGEIVVVARQGAGATAQEFIALSAVCPHLGCAVHWETQRERFFCPCHNGAFDRSGKATEGPPAAAKQQLRQFALKVDRGLLYIAVPTEGVYSQTKEST